RDCIAEQFGQGRAEIVAGWADLRKQRARYAERLAQLLVPGKTVQIEQHRPRRVRDIARMQSSAGQPPQQKAVDRAESDIAPRGRSRRPRPKSLPGRARPSPAAGNAA